MFERIPKSPPVIKPLPYDRNRPLWSVMIPSYNCINYLRDAIVSVLLQAPSAGEMQIEVIDDCSTDGDIESLVEELGKGRIGFYKQPRNVGHLRNFETCLNRTRGRLIHILHGDDAVKPGFYQEIERLFSEHANIGAAFTDSVFFDEKSVPSYATAQIQDSSGVVDSFLLKLAEKTVLQTPSIVVKRSVYEQLGSFYGVKYCEDWLMWTRIAANYEVAYSPRSLAKYRVHSKNNTGSCFITGQNIKDINTTINLFQDYLPEKDRKILKTKAKHHYASFITSGIPDQLYHNEHNPQAAWVQAWGVFKFYPSVNTFYCLLKISTKILIRYKKNMVTAS